ncbi:PCI domain-containing protein [Phlyctema vagabunda]|uniref:PCI domain-containing protein n=1 Tax=Phlyctema vagabunda TaxID=108571 RepID=A0ABR4PJJ2_9HELO
MEQQKALNALEPFLALTKSASSPRAAADLISRATSHPNTFIFSELLHAPQIQALAGNDEYGAHLTLLQIFSYGTYEDYTRQATQKQQSQQQLPTLNEAQALKLRQLSFLTLARRPADLSYARVLAALALETTRELEDLVISAIYAGLMAGTLDPYHQLVSVSSVAPLRDLQPDSIPSMLATLSAWSSRCVSTLHDLEAQIARIKADALQRHKEEAEWNAHMDALVNQETKSSDKVGRDSAGNSGLRGGAGGGIRLGHGAALKRGNGAFDAEGDYDMDDADEDDDDRKGSNKKTKGFAKIGSGK